MLQSSSDCIRYTKKLRSNEIEAVNLNDGASYVPVPDVLKLQDKHLHYLDMLIYASLRSFDNPSDGCFARHETIGKRAGLSKNFAIYSIRRLEDAGLITVERSKKIRVSNKYFFVNKEGSFTLRTEKIPRTIFDAEDLSSNEKALLICIRQFYNHGKLTCMEGVPFYSKWLGLTESTIRKQFGSLIAKGYISKFQSINNHDKRINKRFILSDKLNWDFTHCEKPHQVMTAQILCA